MDKQIKITVITPTIRPSGLEVMRESLMAQTMPHDQWEWIVDINVSGKHDLNASFNKMIKRAKGEIIVFYEDHTKILPDALERWWKAYQEYPETLFTAPLGKVANWGDKPQWDWRSGKQREDQTDYTDCLWRCCELDWGMVPKKILYVIGGFDERLDQWWSMDNVSMGKRADILGYKFKCLFTNPAIAYDHDLHAKHPFREFFNPEKANKVIKEYDENPVLPYLS